MVANGAGHLTRPPALRSAPSGPHSRAPVKKKTCERESPDGHRGYALHLSMARTMAANQGSGHKTGQENKKRRAEEENNKKTERAQRASEDEAHPTAPLCIDSGIAHPIAHPATRPIQGSMRYTSIFHALLRRTTCSTPSADRPPADFLGDTRGPTPKLAGARRSIGSSRPRCNPAALTCWIA
jgi:hypothetical protein